MKILKLSFLISLLTSSYSCWAMDPPTDPESKPSTLSLPKSPPALENIDVALGEVVKKNFKWDLNTRTPRCITKPEEFSDVRTTFGNLLVHSPGHKTLNLYCARFLLHKTEYLEGLQRFSWVILTQKNTDDEIIEFMNSFKLIAIDRKDLTPYINSIDEAFVNPDEFILHNNCTAGIRNPRSSQAVQLINKRITAAVLEKSTSLLTLLKKLPTNSCYDAMLQTILTTMQMHGRGDAAAKLVSTLYNQGPDQASPLLKQNYALHCLIKEKKYEKALPLYESILVPGADGSNYTHVPINYNTLCVLYIATTKPLKETTLNGFKEFEYSSQDVKKLQTVIDLMKLALQLDSTFKPHLLKNIACLHLLLQQYKEALEVYRPLMQLSDDELKEHNCSPKAYKRDYLTILHAAGETQELDEIYRKKLEKHFVQNKEIADLIKAAQSQAQDQKLKRELEAQQQDKKLGLTHAELKKESQIITESIISEKEIPQIPIEKKEKEVVVPKQPKKKTKGKPTKKVSNVPFVEPIKQRPVIFIHQLGLSKTSQQTFKEFFAKYTENREPKVSLKEINSFCANLDKKKVTAGNKIQSKKTLDTNRGTSHHKFTFSPQEYGLEGEEQMAIVTNKIEEKSYQVQHLLSIFLSSRIVPDDPALIKKLEDLGLL